MTKNVLLRLLDNSPDISLVLDNTHTIRYTSAAVSEAAVHASSLLDSPMTDLVHEDDRSALTHILEQAVSNPETPFTSLFRIVDQEEAWHFWEARVRSVILGPDEIYILITMHDATYRLRAQQQLKQREEEYNRAQRVARIGSWELNVSTSQMLVSRQFCRLYGIPIQESVPFEEVSSRFHPDDARRINETLQKARTTMGVFDIHHRVELDDGSIRTIHLRGETELYGSEFIMFGTAQDVTRFKAMEDALRSSERRLHHLAARLNNIQEKERIRLAREVHDVLGQDLTSLRLDIHWFQENATEDVPGMKERAQQAIKQVESTIKDVRRISHELRPAVLDHFGLAAALEWSIKQYQSRSDISFSLIDETGGEQIDPDLSTALFRIFQEAITNVLRHAEASEVRVSLKNQDCTVQLLIEDDGKGFDKKTSLRSSSLGILNMEERVLPWDGTVNLDTAPGKGTKVHVAVPMASLNT